MSVKAKNAALAGSTPIYANIWADGGFVPGDPRERGQWTRGKLVCFIPVPDLRFRDVASVTNARVSWAFAGSGVHMTLEPLAAGIVKFQFAGEGDNYFIYDPPRPGPVPT